MIRFKASLIAPALALLLAGGAAGGSRRTAEDQPKPPRQSWSFYGVFGKFDQAQLQRGFQVYREVCSNCHRLSIPFRTLANPDGPGYSEDQVKTLAASYKVTNDEPERPGQDLQAPRHAGRRVPAAGRLPQRSGRRRRARQGAAGHVAARQVAQIRARLPLVHLRHLRRLSGSRRRLHLCDPDRLHQARTTRSGTSIIPATRSRCRSRCRTARSNIPTARRARCRTTPRTSPRS